MAVSLIGAGTVGSNDQLQSSVISQEEFLKVLLTQLRFQDPMKPLDNQEFLAQMAQFSGLEQTRQLNDRIDTLLTIQSTTQSIGLLGATVDVSTEAGKKQGIVSAMTFEDGAPVFTITAGQEVLTGVSLGQIVQVVRKEAD